MHACDYNSNYFRRLNRLGTNFTERIQKEREMEFEDMLVKSAYRIDFWVENKLIPGILTKKFQNETRQVQYLLVRRNVEIKSGTILTIKSQLHGNKPLKWLVWYKEQIQASGYNRYMLLRITHTLEWTDRDGNVQSQECYLYGKQDFALKDAMKTIRGHALYNEDDNTDHVIMPINYNLKKDDYIKVKVEDIQSTYRVTGYNIVSTPGIEYVTIDKTYLRDETELPDKTPEDKEEDYYWLGGDSWV